MFREVEPIVCEVSLTFCELAPIVCEWASMFSELASIVREVASMFCEAAPMICFDRPTRRVGASRVREDAWTDRGEWKESRFGLRIWNEIVETTRVDVPEARFGRMIFRTQAMTALRTSPWTSVRRKSRPAYGNVSFSWSRPRRARMVAWRSWIWTLFSMAS
jgi:hypothetical protein